MGLHNRSALHALKRNNTMSYLKKKTSAAQRHIFQIARQEGPLLRKENRKREEEVKDAIRAKFVQNQDLKIVKKMKELHALTQSGQMLKITEVHVRHQRM